VTVKVLVPATDASGNVIPDSYVAKVVNVYDVVFNSTNDTTTTGAADFATATNDSLQVLEYVHDNALRF
jgi:tricorn protease-like protein